MGNFVKYGRSHGNFTLEDVKTFTVKKAYAVAS